MIHSHSKMIDWLTNWTEWLVHKIDTVIGRKVWMIYRTQQHDRFIHKLDWMTCSQKHLNDSQKSYEWFTHKLDWMTSLRKWKNDLQSHLNDWQNWSRKWKWNDFMKMKWLSPPQTGNNFVFTKPNEWFVCEVDWLNHSQQMEWFIHESELNCFLSQQLTNSLNIYHWTFAFLFCKTYVSFYKWWLYSRRQHN